MTCKYQIVQKHSNSRYTEVCRKLDLSSAFENLQKQNSVFSSPDTNIYIHTEDKE